MKKLAAYLRVSTTEQDNRSQRHAIETWIKQQGLKPSAIEWYADKASGKSADRSDLQRMLRDIDAGKISAVIVFQLSRLSRKTIDGLQLLGKLQEQGIRFVSVNERIDLSSSMGKVIATLLLSFAQWERECLIERVRAGLSAAREAGVKLGRPRDEKRLKRIKQMHLKGDSVVRIAERLQITRQAVYQALDRASA